MKYEQTMIWLAIFVLLLVIEIATVNLTTIWFAGGAFIAFIAAQMGASVMVQIFVFLAVSILVLFLLRPSAVRYFNEKRQKTNLDAVIGKEARVTETIDNRQGKGVAIIDGKEWTARAEEDDMIIEAGTLAKVIKISGVKIILSNKEEK